ncbi:MAG: hypothetical protein NUW01_05510 [Gemmatimonadaceae bacterium]|nr:hypothetical protein [Gemmatimonadaceae bacterium]
MRGIQTGHNTARSVVRHSATILFCALAALGLLRCADPVGVPMDGAPTAPRFTHLGEPEYEVSSIAFTPDATPTGTHPNLESDDGTTGLIPIGFDFEFFGTTYSQVNISSNGFIGFAADMSDGCCEGRSIPRADFVNNVIAAIWSDLTPDATGRIWYGVSGTAPNRRFVVHFENVSFFAPPTVGRVNVQIKLFERTNVIEIHTLSVPPDFDHVHTQGIENATGTHAHFVPGRVATSFVLSNDAVRFRPPSPDVTPPVIAATVAGTVGDNDWYTSNVGVTWSVTDAESDITGTSGCDAVSITTDQQATTYTCSASSLGGSASESVSVKRDATSPVVTYGGNASAYTVDQSVSIACDASDATSGVASTTCVDVTGDAHTFGLGTSAFSASATDNAGNVGGASTSFTVSVTPASLCNLVRRWVNQKGVATSLCQRLANGAYDAFRNQVGAQSGKQIPADKAALLISLSNEL